MAGASLMPSPANATLPPFLAQFLHNALLVGRKELCAETVGTDLHGHTRHCLTAVAGKNLDIGYSESMRFSDGLGGFGLYIVQ